jgi:DNA (cytosine-5)-methyltransferase 1
LWASEIEPFPIEVTKIRFPEMLHVGDICNLNGAELPPVSIITGGSPCQDLSVAGRRLGLAGERSGLFMEQIRIVKEMRDADKRRGRADESVRPRFMLWENVPGAFSSGSEHSEDFRAVLEEVCGVAAHGLSVPRPPGGRWQSAGAILGDKFSVAWRVVCAQYFFVPQRRKRIVLVCDFAGHSAHQILFEQDRLLGHFTPRGEAGEAPARDTGESAEDASWHQRTGPTGGGS